MFRRAIMFLFTLTLIMSFSVVSYAGESDVIINGVEDDGKSSVAPIEILDPVPSASGDVMVSGDHLFIQVKINEEMPMHMSLVYYEPSTVGIDPVVPDVELDENVLAILNKETMEDNEIESSEAADGETEEEEPGTLEAEDVVDSVLDASEVVLNSDNVTMVEKREIINDYNNAYHDLVAENEAFTITYDTVVEIFADESGDIAVPEIVSEEQMAVAEECYDAYLRLLETVEVFETAQDGYLTIYKNELIDQEPVVKSSTLPFYTKTVENVMSGQYELIFEGGENDEFYESMAFELTKGDDLSEEQITTSVTTTLKSEFTADTAVVEGMDEKGDD